MSTDDKRWDITSTWGQHHILAPDAYAAEEQAEEDLEQMGHGDAKILDGLTERWSSNAHGEWEGSKRYDRTGDLERWG